MPARPPRSYRKQKETGVGLGGAAVYPSYGEGVSRSSVPNKSPAGTRKPVKGGLYKNPRKLGRGRREISKADTRMVS